MANLLSVLVIGGKGQYRLLKQYLKFSWCMKERGGGEEPRNLAIYPISKNCRVGVGTWVPVRV